MKKEIKKKKDVKEEDEEDEEKIKIKVYKTNRENIELEITPNDYPMREYDESDRNPYTILIKGYSDPGKLFNFIQMRLLLIKGVEVKKSYNEKYKLTIAIDPSTQDADFELGGDFLIDKVESLLELKYKDDKFIIVLRRLLGNKYDYHRLFIELEKQLA